MNVALRLAVIAAVMGAACVAGAALFGTAGAFAGAVIGVAASAWLGWRVSLIVDRMADAAVRMTDVERGHRIRPEGPPELRRLGRAVNRIADRMGALIEAETAERTRLSSILDTMSEGVVVVDAEGVVESANPAALAVLGAPQSFRAGQLLTSLTGNFSVNQAAVDCARTGTPRQAEVELFEAPPAGPRPGRRFVQVIAAPLGKRSGPTRALVLITDLTEARRLDVTRKEFVSNASHELRTPIAAIKAAIETLQRGAVKDPAAAEDFMRRINEDAQRMDALVREMLELSRLESGQTPLHLAPRDAGAFLALAADRFQPQAAEDGIRVLLEVEDGLPPVNADSEQLERALSNLVGNSLKFTPRGGSVTLSAVRFNGGVALKVKDTGRGIAAEHLPHIFERFYKADSSRADGGAGLGLAIAKHVVLAHGGTVSVESRPGQGSTFTVSLPALTVR